MAKLEERCRLKIYWALPVSVQIRVGAPRVDVCTIVSAPKKSKEVGFAGSSRKPAIYGGKGS